jgi:hypothetical protein|tara:strand:+ start:681 stop:854 length:174 start_codon:yes stop_codon:yes gene_type:complete
MKEQGDKKLAKPPVGLRPKYISDAERLEEVKAAIVRYFKAELEIPVEWVEEYNNLIK